MKCPNCKDTNLSLSDRAGIEIDYCPECRGVWLDRGELDKIIERSREQQAVSQAQPPNQSAYSSHSSAYYQKPYKRKKSFLEELFD